MAGHGVELLDASPVFAEQMRAWTGPGPLCRVVADGCAARSAGRAGLDRVDVVQPALFAVMVSLAALWRSVGVCRTR